MGNGEMKLRAGTPDDANRHYLPESIYRSDIVVNENGNSSQPYPERLQEFEEDFGDGVEGMWYEYVPSTYDGTKKVPLIVSLHGGLMTGWGQCIYSSWSYLAEREGFIVVYPNGSFNHFWITEIVPGSPFAQIRSLDGIETPPSQSPDENYDIKLIRHVIEKARGKYNIDGSRIFMQGMSNGSGMTKDFSRFFGQEITGAAFSAAAGRINHLIDADGNVINRGGPLSIWISHPELNDMGRDMEGEAESVRQDNYYWFRVNEIDTLPAISIEGEHNMAFFRGRKADMVFDDIKNRDHGQALDEAFYYWDYLFAGSRRTESGIHQEEPVLSRAGDAHAAAFAEGIDRVWYQNRVMQLSSAPLRWQKYKYHGLKGDTITRGEYLMVPVRILAQIAGGEFCEAEDTLTSEIIMPDGTVLQFARGSIACILGKKLRSMYCEAVHRNGELLISAEWFAKYVLNWYVSECNGVLYMTDHMADLSYFMADMMKRILTDRLFPADMVEHILNTPAW